MENRVVLAALGTGFTFLMTVLGAAVVFLFRKEIGEKIQKCFLGFAAGVMMAASVWSLLLPAIEEAEKAAGIAWLPAAGGFLAGGLFLYGIDFLLCCQEIFIKIQRNKGQEKTQTEPEKEKEKKRLVLMVSAVTLHNIPEGMAVGLAFALAAQKPEDTGTMAAAFALAAGIGIQNLPEGSALSLPLCQAGFEKKKAFLTGSLSGIVEPVFGIGVTLLAEVIRPFMPWLLSLAAGAMIYVVAQELIPQAKGKEEGHMGTLGVMTGFLIMMVLDVAFG